METSSVENPAMQVQYPALSERVQSIFIDTLFIVIMMFISAAILDRFQNVPDWVRIVLFVSLFGIYEPICTTLGFTIGNYFKGIRVRKISNPGKRINIFQAFFRYVLKVFLGWLSFLTIHTNKERRAIHDLAVGSVVIKAGS